MGFLQTVFDKSAKVANAIDLHLCDTSDKFNDLEAVSRDTSKPLAKRAVARVRAELGLGPAIVQMGLFEAFCGACRAARFIADGTDHPLNTAKWDFLVPRR